MNESGWFKNWWYVMIEKLWFRRPMVAILFIPFVFMWVHSVYYEKCYTEVSFKEMCKELWWGRKAND